MAAATPPPKPTINIDSHRSCTRTGNPAPAGGGDDAAEEQTEFTVMLTAVGGEKIKVIKEIRAINPTLGLKDAKAVADSAPSELVKDVSKDEAADVQKRLEAVGASVEIK